MNANNQKRHYDRIQAKKKQEKEDRKRVLESERLSESLEDFVERTTFVPETYCDICCDIASNFGKCEDRSLAHCLLMHGRYGFNDRR